MKTAQIIIVVRAAAIALGALVVAPPALAQAQSRDPIAALV